MNLLQGFLAGLAEPVLGPDHLLFVIGAGALATRFERGWFLPLVFVAVSLFAAVVHYLGADLAPGALPLAASLVLLGAMLLAARTPGEGVVALLLITAGTLHGYALAGGGLGAAREAFAAFLAGMALAQGAIGLAAWRATGWISARCPKVPARQLAGGVISIAGLVFAGLAMTS